MGAYFENWTGAIASAVDELAGETLENRSHKHVEAVREQKSTALCCWARTDMSTAFAVFKPHVISKVQEETDVHGWLIAAFLEELRNLQGLAEFESCETSVDIPSVSENAPWKLQRCE